jgi:hypothetical protein
MDQGISTNFPATSRYIADTKSGARNHWSSHQHIKSAKEKKEKKKKKIESEQHSKKRSVKKLIRDVRSVDVISDNGSPLADAEQFKMPSYYPEVERRGARFYQGDGSSLTLGGKCRIHFLLFCVLYRA